MLALWQRIVSLSDPQLTADFQRLCGIKPIQSSHLNGVDLPHSSVRLPDVNGIVGVCDSKNVHADDCHTNGGLHQNGSSSMQINESLRERISRSKHINGCSQTNGSLTVLQHLTDPPNDCSSQCQYVSHTSSQNHKSTTYTRNGILNEDNTKFGFNGNKATNDSHKQSYVIENRVLFYLFSFGASLGNEIFYIVFFTYGMWNFDSYVFRKTTIPWCISMYLGQAAKDIICWPRPSSPPAVRLEERYELEYGMPSTHAIVGVAIPFGLLYYTYDRYEYNLLLGVMIAGAWCVLVSFSRLYLGMHSVLDILTGIVSAFFLMACTIPFTDMLDTLLIAHPWSFPGLNIAGLTLCLLYPRLKVWSTARGDTTQSIAVFSGIYQGMWLLARHTTLEEATSAALSVSLGWEFWMNGILRQILGTGMLVALLELLKKAVIYLTALSFGLNPKDPTTKQYFWVELPYKYIGYFVPSFCGAYYMPYLFQYLGLLRGNFLVEIHTYASYFDSYRCDSCSNDSEDIENSKQTVDYDASSVFTKLNIISLDLFPLDV